MRFLGYFERGGELQDCYSAADVFVFSSLTETQGLVLLEAMAQGVPVVAIPRMGTIDILGPGLGCRHAPNDRQGLRPGGSATLLADRAAHAVRWASEAPRVCPHLGVDHEWRSALSALYASLASRRRPR